VPDDPNTDHLTHKQKQENRIVEKILALLVDRAPKESAPQNVLKSEDLDKFLKFMETARVIAASAILAAMFAAIYEYLALMGIADVSPARIVLLCAWLFGAMFAWEVVALFIKSSKKAKIRWMVLSIMVWAGVLFGLDKWAVRWQHDHPSEIAKLAQQEEAHRKNENAQLARIETNMKSVIVTPQFNIPTPAVPAPKADLVLDSFASAYTDSNNSPILFIWGKPAEFNFNYHNIGNGRADKIQTAGRIVFATSETEKEVTDSFKTDLARELANSELRSQVGYSTLQPGGGIDSQMWFTIRSARNSVPDDVVKLADGSERLYLLTFISYDDPQGPHYVQRCELMQALRPNEPKQIPIWHFCNDFSDRK